jgi:hypothetical protein
MNNDEIRSLIEDIEEYIGYRSRNFPYSRGLSIAILSSILAKELTLQNVCKDEVEDLFTEILCSYELMRKALSERLKN